MRPSRLEPGDTKGSRSGVTESDILELRLFDSLTYRRKATLSSVSSLRADSVVLGHQRLHSVSTGVTNGSIRTTAARVQPAVLALQVGGGPDSNRRSADGSSSAAASCFACLSRRRAAEDGFYTSDPDPNTFLCNENEQEDPVLLSALRSLRSALATLSGWSIRLRPSRSQTIIVDGKPAKLREHLRTRRPKRPILRSRPSSDPGGSFLGTITASLGTPSQKRLRFAADELQADLDGQEDGASVSDAAANPTAAASEDMAWSGGSTKSANPSGGNVWPVDGVAVPVGEPHFTGAQAINNGVDCNSLVVEKSAASGLPAGGLMASTGPSAPAAFQTTSSSTLSVGSCGGPPVRDADACSGDGETEIGSTSPNNTARQTLSGVSTGAAAAAYTSDSRFSVLPAPVSVGSYAREHNSALATEPSVGGTGCGCRADSSGCRQGVNGPGAGGSGLIASLSSRRSLKPQASRGQIVPLDDFDTQSQHCEGKPSSTAAGFEAQQNAGLPAPLAPTALSRSTASPSLGPSPVGWGIFAGQAEEAVNPTEQEIAPTPGASPASNLASQTSMPAKIFTSPGAPPPTPTSATGSQVSRPPNLVARLWLLAGPNGSCNSGSGSCTTGDWGRDASPSASVVGYQHVSAEFPRQGAPGRVLHNALFEPDGKAAVSAPGMPPTALRSPQPQQGAASYTSPGMIQFSRIERGDCLGIGGDGPTVVPASTIAVQLPTPEYVQHVRPEHQHVHSQGSQKHKDNRGRSQDSQRVHTPDNPNPAALQWWTTVRPLDEEEEEGSSDGRRCHSGTGNGDGGGAREHMMHSLEGARRTFSVTDGAMAEGARWPKGRWRPSDNRNDVEDEDEAFMRNLGVGQAAGNGANTDGGAGAGGGRRSIRNSITSGAAPRVSAARDLPLRDGRRSGLTYADLSYSVQQAVLTVQSTSSRKQRKTGSSIGGCGSDASSSPKASVSAVTAVQRSQQIRAAPFAAALGLLQPSFSSGGSSSGIAAQLHLRRWNRTLSPPRELPITRSVHDGLGSHSGGAPGAGNAAATNMDPPSIVERPCTYGSTDEQDPKTRVEAAEPRKAENAAQVQVGENRDEGQRSPQAVTGSHPQVGHCNRWAEEIPFIVTDIPSETAAALLEPSVHPVSATVTAQVGYHAAGRRRTAVSDPEDGIPVFPSGSTLTGGVRERSFAGMSALLSQTLAARMEMTSSGPHTIYRSDRSATASNIRAAPFAAVLGLLQQRPRPAAASNTPQLRAAVASGRSFTSMLSSTAPSQTEATTAPVAGIGVVRALTPTGRGNALRRVAADSYAADMHSPMAVGGGCVRGAHFPFVKLPGGIDSTDDVSMDRGAVVERRSPLAAETLPVVEKPPGEPVPPVSLGVRTCKTVRRSITESVLMGRNLSASSMFSQALDEVGIPGQMAAH